MSFPRGSFSRMAVAALLAPLGPALCLLPVIDALHRNTSSMWAGQGIREFLLGWLAVSLLISVLGLLLRSWKRTALRHHILATLAIGALPILLTLTGWLASVNRNVDPDTVTLAHPCFELFRSETFGLQAAVSQALLLSIAGMSFKWLAYGLDRDSRASPAWQAAGVFYVLALLVDIGGQIGNINGAIPTWSSWMGNYCD
jgi:hypothetical protein